MDESTAQFRLTEESASDFDPTFGNAATDYERYRATYPSELFDRLKAAGVETENRRVLDLGTGTGFLARELRQRGSSVIGVDLDRELLAVARRASREGADRTAYIRAKAEQIPIRENSVDLVTAGQCWHWFDRDQVCSEVQRVITSGGTVVITHFDWQPRNRNVVDTTEQLILDWNPDWPGAGGTGFYPDWTRNLSEAQFQNIETFSFETTVEYSHEAWRGRIRASAGVGGSLSEEEIREFDEQLDDHLQSSFPDEPLEVPHRSFTVICTAP